MKEKPIIRFFFEQMCESPLWCGNDEALTRFDGGPIDPESLGLSPTAIGRMRELAHWHNQSLNWNSPSDPGPWRQDECDRFNIAVKSLFEVVRRELSDEFELIYCQDQFNEDPDLDAFMSDPKSFRRKKYLA